MTHNHRDPVANGPMAHVEQYAGGFNNFSQTETKGHHISSEIEARHEKSGFASKEEEFNGWPDLDVDQKYSRSLTSDSSVTQWDPEPARERPKKVSTRSRRWAIFHIMRFHGPSLSITLFLMVLYFRNWIWEPPGPSVEIRNSLQFAAKIHEGLIILSLSSIILHRLRSLLLHDQGVPLGLLTSPFQLASPFYFVSPEFWGAVRSCLGEVQGNATVFLIVASLLLAMAIGPFSAIVMLPRYGLWQLPSSYGIISQFQDYMNTGKTSMPQQHSPSLVRAISQADLYPKYFGPELGVSWKCRERPMDGENAFGCRTYINLWFTEVIHQINSLNEALIDGPKVNGAVIDADIWYATFGDMSTIGMAQDNVTNLMANGFLWLASNVDNMGDKPYYTVNSLAMATYPLWITTEGMREESGVLATEFTNASTMVKHGEILQSPTFLAGYPDGCGGPEACDGTRPVPMKQAAVMTHCSGDIFSSDNLTAASQLTFANALFPTFNLTLGDTLTTLVWNSSHSHKPSFMSYVDIRHSIPFPTSTAAVSVSYFYDTITHKFTPLRLVEVCIVSARWVEVDTWGRNTITWSVLKDKPITLINQTRDSDPAEIIAIDADWMMQFDYRPYSYATTEEESNMSDYDFFAGNSAGAISGWRGPGSLSLGISSMLGFALSTTQCAFSPCLSIPKLTRHVNYTFTRQRNMSEAYATGDYLRIATTYWVYAYGYGVEGSWLTAIGLAVLAFHALLVLGHVVDVIGRKFWTSDAWGSQGELLALALRSSPPHLLANTTAGVSSLSTWELVAAVREKTSEDRLELVLRERGARSRVVLQGASERGVADTRKEEPGDLVLPRPDKKYG